MSTWEAMTVESGTWFSLVAQVLQKAIAATKVETQSLTKKPLQLSLKSHISSWMVQASNLWSQDQSSIKLAILQDSTMLMKSISIKFTLLVIVILPLSLTLSSLRDYTLSCNQDNTNLRILSSSTNPAKFFSVWD